MSYLELSLVPAPAFDGLASRLNRALRHPLTPILLIAAILRLIYLGTAALRYDETGTVWMASLPFARMIAATAGDMHPPGYLALMWVWVRLFGVSEFAVRLPSVMFSLAAIPLAGRIGTRVQLGRTALIVGAALIAVMPSQILYAQEARMYALLQLEVLIALWAVLEFRWLTFGLTLAAMLWTHNYGVVYAMPLNALALVMVIIECKRKNIPVIAKLTLLIGANGFGLGCGNRCGCFAPCCPSPPSCTCFLAGPSQRALDCATGNWACYSQPR